jgi:hypothetical protein
MTILEESNTFSDGYTITNITDLMMFDDVQFSDWNTPDFVRIKKKKTKRISPYLENELWEKEDLLTIVKYESYKKSKAILALLWDLDARPHEITLLKIKHIRLKEKYGEGEIPHEAKTGTGPILLTLFMDNLFRIVVQEIANLLHQKNHVANW